MATSGVSLSISNVHDVFLSFRSIDTGKIFVDPLCKALKLRGIPTFSFDGHEFEAAGEEIMSSVFPRAIKVSIVVLSENYSSSRWCLHELVQILKSNHAVVIPIFYHVTPEDVRHQSNKFGKAFEKHKDTIKKKKDVQTWKAALTQISNLSGYHVSNLQIGLELKLIFEIVDRVKLEISNYVPLHTATHHPASLKSGTGTLESTYSKSLFPPAFGMFSQVDTMEVQLDFPQSEYTMFDIKELRSLMQTVLKHKLPKSKFVAVRNLKVMHIRNPKLSEIPDNLSFPDLEEVFLQSNVDLSYIPSSFFEQMPALKVLDMSNTSIKSLPHSVFTLFELEELHLRNCELLMELSHEILALQNLKVLNLSGCTNLAENLESIDFPQRLSSLDLADCKSLTKLPKSISKLRFLHHLYLSACTNLADIPEYIELLQGLSLLDLTDCKSLTKLPESISKLRSLESLYLSGCTNLAEIIEFIDLPQSLSLLDLGDCISLTKLPESISKLRSLKSLYLSGCTNLAEIPESIELLERLSLLDLTDCRSLTKLPESISKLSSLEYLYLSGCTNLAELPESIDFTQFIDLLNLTDCKSLTKLPESISKLRSLETLRLSGCSNLAEIPEFIDFPQSVSTVDLTDCRSLTKLPECLFKPSSLKYLTLSGCTNLAEINGSIGFLSGLSILDLRDCKSLTKLPESICNLRSLECLYLSGCTNLAEIPEFIEFLDSLFALDLRDCKSLTKLPKNISKLRSLQYLFLSGCSSLFEVPTGLNDSESPRKFHAAEISINTLSTSSQADTMEVQLDFHQSHSTLFDITELLGLIEKVLEYKLLQSKFVAVINLKVIHIRNFKLPQFPDNLSFPDLEKLFLQPNLDLTCIPSTFFERMPALKVLDMSYTSIKTLPSWVYKLIQLEELILKSCELLVELPHDINTLKNLKVLDLEGTDLVCLPKKLGGLTKLKCLKFSLYDAESYINSKEIVDIIPVTILSKLTQLEELSINVDPQDIWCNAAVKAIINDLPGLRNLKTLKLYLPTTELLEDLLERKWSNNDLSIYQNLSNFNFIIGPHAQRFISRLPCELEEEFLKLEKCLKFINGEDNTTKFAEALKHAHALYLDRHWTIQKLSVFKLEELDELRFCLLVDCNEMHTIFDESDFNHSLQYLAIHYLKNLEVIWKGPGAGCCFHSLKVLALHMCPNLNTIFSSELAGELVNLEEIIVEDCPKIKFLIQAYISLPRLKKLSLLYLPELVSISSGLSIGPELESVVIYDCPKLKKLPSVVVFNKEVIQIKGESEWWDALEWNEPELSGGQPNYLSHAFSELDIDIDLLDGLAQGYGNSLQLFVKECNAD